VAKPTRSVDPFEPLSDKERKYQLLYEAECKALAVERERRQAAVKVARAHEAFAAYLLALLPRRVKVDDARRPPVVVLDDEPDAFAAEAQSPAVGSKRKRVAAPMSARRATRSSPAFLAEAGVAAGSPRVHARAALN